MLYTNTESSQECPTYQRRNLKTTLLYIKVTTDRISSLLKNHNTNTMLHTHRTNCNVGNIKNQKEGKNITDQ